MKKIILFFNSERNQSIYATYKSNAFIILNMVLIVLLFFLLINEFLGKKSITTLLVLPTAIIFIVSILFILKYKALKIAGSIFSVGLMVLQSIPLNMMNMPTDQIFLKYIHGFYLVFVILVISFFFGTRKVLLFNGFLLFSTIIHVYISSIRAFPNQPQMVNTGILFYLVSFFVVILTLYFASIYSEKTLLEVVEKSNKNEEQKKALLKLVHGIKETTIDLSKSSEQLASVSSNVAQNSNEQASSFEEISASMEQILSTLIQSTQSIEKTGDNANKTAVDVQKGKEVFLKMIEQVNIISQKISMISEIANKTDILSINAAIEAAKADEAGQGFAVVAEEIRKLADRTKTSSIEINKISKYSKKISNLAALRLQKSLNQVLENAQLFEGIVLSSKEQENGVEAINSSIIQLSNITNENSGIAEQMSSAAEELSNQMNKLKNLILDFKD